MDGDVESDEGDDLDEAPPLDAGNVEEVFDTLVPVDAWGSFELRYLESARQ